MDQKEMLGGTEPLSKGDFKRTCVIFKFFCKFFFMMFVSNNFAPFFGVFVAFGHNNCNFLCPRRAEFQNSFIYFHSDVTRICNNQSFSGEQI